MLLATTIENVLETEDENIEKFDCTIDAPVVAMPTGPCSPPVIGHSGYMIYNLKLTLWRKPKNECNQTN